ncbi:MAG: hypothetical protein HOC20_11970 [Chloroflexi bacterium]|jgi:hypothetical protein|nr:hypothetical protein [Chloroflexota bacterium]
MKLGLEKHSYKSGEIHLNTKPAIKEEIESILLAQSPVITKWSRDEYVRIIETDFIAKGWEVPPPMVDKRGKQTQLMDFRKEKVGVKLGLHSSSAQSDILRFQKAQEFQATQIDLGIYVSTTAACQQQLGKASGKPWGGPSFHTIARSLTSLSRMVSVPVCIIGLDIVQIPVRTIDIDSTPPSLMKEFILSYLERYYGKKIDKNVRVIGKKVNEVFDGVLRLPDKDVILALEVSRSAGRFPTRLLSDSILGFLDAVREYREITRPEACLRFVLMGEFSADFIGSIFGDAGVAYGYCEGIEVEYEAHSFQEFEDYLTEKREALLNA